MTAPQRELIAHLRKAHQHFTRAGLHLGQAKQINKVGSNSRGLETHLLLACDALDRGFTHLGRAARVEDNRGS